MQIRELERSFGAGAIAPRQRGHGSVFVRTLRKESSELREHPAKPSGCIYKMRSVRREGIIRSVIAESTGERWRERIFAALAVVAALASLVFAIGTLNRGLGFTDDSVYMLTARYPLHGQGTLLQYGHITWFLWQLAPSIAAFRAVGLLLTLASVALLIEGLLRATARHRLLSAPTAVDRILIYSSATASALLYTTLISMAPSYNLVAGVGAHGAIGAALWSVSEDKSSKGAWLAATASGALLAAAGVGKLTTGFLAAGLVVLMYLTAVERWWTVLRMTLTLAVARLSYIACFRATQALAPESFVGGYESPVQQSVSSLTTAAANTGLWINDTGRALWVLALRHLRELETLFVPMIFPVAVACLFLFLSRFVILRWRTPVRILGLLWPLHLATMMAARPNYEHEIRAVTLMLLAALILSVAGNRPPARLALWSLIIALIPTVVAAGTGNAITQNMIGAQGSWGLLLGLAAFTVRCVDRGSVGARTALQQGLVVLSAATCAAMIWRVGLGIPPYNLPAGFKTQVHPVNLGSYGMLLVDTDTAREIRAAQEIARSCGLRSASPFFGAYLVHGFAIALDMVPLNPSYIKGRDQAETRLRGIDPAVARRTVVLRRQHRNGKHDALPSVFEGFPQNRTLCGVVAMPLHGTTVEIWSPERPVR